VAQHYNHLIFPYRRYHIAPVWRGERPQTGRYRQFYQCDIDIIGDNILTAIHDGEILSIIYEILMTIGIKNFVIQVSNCQILTNLIKSFGILDKDVSNIMRIIDKADKISKETLVIELKAYGLVTSNISILMNLIDQTMSNQEWLIYLNKLSDIQEFRAALEALTKLLQDAENFGVPDQYIQITPGLARGLNYYTGTMYETKWLDFPMIGSICSGGSYANLAQEFTNKKLPGIGVSFGISRFFPKLIESNIINANSGTNSLVLVSMQNKELTKQYIEIAQKLRSNNIATELYMSHKSLDAQMKYAHKKGFKFVIIADHNEFMCEKLILRNMKEHTQIIIDSAKLIEILKTS
jgi:histidyl-tRNA synthetase